MIDMDGPCICPGDPDHDPHPTPCGAPNSGGRSWRVPAADPTTRSLVAKIAANTRVAHTVDRKAMTAPARAKWNQRWEREVDPGGKLDPEERQRRAAAARRAYMQKLALRSAQVRRKGKK